MSVLLALVLLGYVVFDADQLIRVVALLTLAHWNGSRAIRGTVRLAHPPAGCVVFARTSLLE